MRLYFLIVILILVSLLSACTGQQETPIFKEEISKSSQTQTFEQGEKEVPTTEVPQSEIKEYSEKESESIAESVLYNSPTFSSRGIKDSIRLLTTSSLDELYSWQFEYEFQCRFPGYGTLGNEPTPQVLTPHKAQIVVQEGKVVTALIDGEWNILSNHKTAIDTTDSLPKGNLIRVHFSKEQWYTISEDTFINHPIPYQLGWRALQPVNEPDETKEPVRNLRLTLESETELEVEHDKLVTMGPPTYIWLFGDLAEDSEYANWSWDAFILSKSQTGGSPGFDAARSFDQTQFSESSNQTITIIITPRNELIMNVNIYVHTNEDDCNDAMVVSYSSSNGGDISITDSGHRSGLHNVPAEVDVPLTITVTLTVTPKVPCSIYKPYIAINTHHSSLISPKSGIITGNSVSVMNEVGIWTWIADGDYVWQWFDSGIRDVEVHWPPYSKSCSS